MKLTWTKPMVVASFGLLAMIGTGCEKLKSRDELNKGVQSFKATKYPDAVNHFRTAVDLDPAWTTPRLYLAASYMSQWIPGANSPDNTKNAQNAYDQFTKVLEQEPNNTMAMEYIASLEYNQAKSVEGAENKLKKLDEAQAWYQKLATADPKSKTAYYSLGDIAWEKWYPVYAATRVKLGMKPEDPGPFKDKKVREELKAKYGQSLQEGIDNLNKALAIDPEYDDAMAYINLIIRQRADLNDDPAQYKKDIETADNWVQKALEVKRIKAARVNAAPSGVTVNPTK